MKLVQLVRVNKAKAVWLLPVVVLSPGLIPGVVDSAMWKMLGAILFLGAISTAISGLFEFQWKPKKVRQHPAVEVKSWQVIQRRISA